MTSFTITSLLVVAVAFGLCDCHRACEETRKRCTNDLYKLVYKYREHPSTIDVDAGCSVMDTATTCMGNCSEIMRSTSETIRPIMYLCDPSRRNEVKSLLKIPCLKGSSVTEKYEQIGGFLANCAAYAPLDDATSCMRSKFTFNCLSRMVNVTCGDSAASIVVGMLKFSTPKRKCD